MPIDSNDEVYSQEYERLFGAADRYFGAFGAFSLVLAVFAWFRGDVTIKAPLLIASLPVVNLPISQILYRLPNINKVHAELIRTAVMAVLCPIVFFAMEPALSPWWPCYIVFLLGAVIVTGLTAPTRRWARGMVLFWAVDLIVATIIAKEGFGVETDFYQIAYLAGTLIMLGMVSIEWMHTTRTAYKQLDTQRLKASQQSKMAALGEMAGGMAHEINNPLAIIQLSLRQLKGDVTNNKYDANQFAERLKLIESTIIRISKIVQGLRNFSRNAEDDPLVVTSLAEVVENTLTLCREKFREHNIEIITNVSLEHSIKCRPVQVSQVLLNLLNNAFDAVELLPEPRWVKVESAEANVSNRTMIQLKVTDCGNGIPPKIADKIFQPFFTTKEIGKGTGLGLSISKGLTEAQGGSLALDASTPNTTFVINLVKS